jgi:Zn-finger nucleic acid-binding protein
MKKCPKCGSELKEKVIGSVSVDECESCKGIWFERGELHDAEESVDEYLHWLDFEIWKHPEKFKSRKSKLNCPSCESPTVVFEYGHTGIEINYCQQCHGIWLDKDEFPKIIESFENEIANMTLSDYVHASLHEAKEVVTGQESLMTDWKDLSSILKLMQYRLFVEKPKLVETLTDWNTLNPFK